MNSDKKQIAIELWKAAFSSPLWQYDTDGFYTEDGTPVRNTTYPPYFQNALTGEDFNYTGKLRKRPIRDAVFAKYKPFIDMVMKELESEI